MPLSVERHTFVTVTMRSPKSKDVNRDLLSPQALATAREIIALAALAASSDGTLAAQAANGLAKVSDDPQALAWLLETSTREDQWAAVAEFPPAVPVPPHLRRPVAELIDRAVDSPSSYLAGVVAKLLPVLGPEQLRVREARKVLQVVRMECPLRVAARYIIRTSTSRPDRAMLIDDALTAASIVEQVSRLSALGTLSRGREQDAAKTVLTALQQQPINPADAEAVAHLANELPSSWIREWLHATWPSNAKGQLLTSDFVRIIGSERLTLILTPDAPTDLVTTAAQAAMGLDERDKYAVLTHAFEVCVAEPQGVLVSILNAPAGGVPELAWKLLVTRHGAPHVLDFANATIEGQLGQGAGQVKGGPGAPDRLAAVAAAIAVARSQRSENGLLTPPIWWYDDVLEAHTTLGPELLMSLAHGLQTDICLSRLLPAILASDDVALAFVEAGFEAQLSPEATAEQSERLLRVASLRLDDPRVAALLEQIGWSNVKRWHRSLDLAARKNPAIVASAFIEVLELAGGDTEAARPNTEVIAVTTRAALDAGLAGLGEETAKLVRILLRDRDLTVVHLGTEWLRRLPSASLDQAIVDVVTEADEDRQPADRELRNLRVDIAEKLVAAAQETSTVSQTRIERLRLARLASPETAREASFALANSLDDAVSAAAADVLGDTDGAPGDADRIASLLEGEHRLTVTASLRRAQLRLRAPTATAAIEAVLKVMECAYEPHLLLVTKLARDEDSNERLLAAANRVLGSSGPGNQPEDFIINACALGDELLDSSIVAAADHGDVVLSSAAVAEIRQRTARRMDSGSLVHNQKVLERFPWVSDLASLRQVRTAHSAPKGSTRPIQITEADRIAAKTQLGRIVLGWLQDMSSLSPHSS